MLVLSRKLDESIVIGGSITVTIIGLGGQRVKIGIEAPPEISLVRQELLSRADDARNLEVSRGDDSHVEPEASIRSPSFDHADMMTPGA